MDIKEILKEYQFKRDIKRDELDERIKRIYKKYPDIELITKEIQKNGLEMTKLAVSIFSMNDDEKKDINRKIDSLEEKETFLINRKKELFRKYGIDEKELEMQYDCTRCNDTGFLESGKKCNCLKQRLINEAYKNSNMLNLLKRENFDTFNLDIFPDEEINGVNIRKSMSRIMKEAYNYSINFPNVSKLSSQDGKDNMIFIGNAGLGKTFICSCIAKEILDRGYTVIYQTSFNLLEVIEKYKFRQEDYSYEVFDNYEKIFSCDLLIIDDLGTEMQNSFTVSEIFNVINSRIINNKKTIISTNMNFKELRRTYTDRIVSRILGSYKYYTFIGKDLRFLKLSK